MDFTDRLFLLWAYLGFLALCFGVLCGFAALWVRISAPRGMATPIKRRGR